MPVLLNQAHRVAPDIQPESNQRPYLPPVDQTAPLQRFGKRRDHLWFVHITAQGKDHWVICLSIYTSTANCAVWFVIQYNESIKGQSENLQKCLKSQKLILFLSVFILFSFSRSSDQHIFPDFSKGGKKRRDIFPSTLLTAALIKSHLSKARSELSEREWERERKLDPVSEVLRSQNPQVTMFFLCSQFPR